MLVKKLSAGLFFFIFLLLSRPAFAAIGETGNPLIIVFALAAMSLAPFVLIMITSFVKISVVLSLIRRAVGLQQTPSNQVINGLAIIMTVYIMMPVGVKIYDNVSPLFQAPSRGRPLVSESTADMFYNAVVRAKAPIKEFLQQNAHENETRLFYNLALKLHQDNAGEQTIQPDDFIVLVPSFVISELKEAFQIGFIIYIPFIVIDMVVSNVLLAMGMMMLSPITVSLPFKILLFVLIDGWYLISRGLVVGYIH